MINIKNLSVFYYTEQGVAKALDDINLNIRDGIILGVVGESGCGKSTLALSLMRLLPIQAKVVSGSININGTDILKLKEDEFRHWRNKKISIVFQGAMNSLNPVINVENQVAEPLIIHEKLQKEEAIKIAREKLKDVGLSEDVGKRFPHQLSGGMKQRVVIAMAIIQNPQILILDEPTTALDVVTQSKIINLIKKLRDELNLTIIFITHDLSLVAEISDRIVVMYGGKIMEEIEKKDLIGKILHPYTIGLLNSIPDPFKKRNIKTIPGNPISLINPPPGCRFYSRCTFSKDECKIYDYKPFIFPNDHIIYCLLYGDKNGRNNKNK